MGMELTTFAGETGEKSETRGRREIVDCRSGILKKRENRDSTVGAAFSHDWNNFYGFNDLNGFNDFNGF